MLAVAGEVGQGRALVRLLRIEFAGALCHLVSRGNEQWLVVKVLGHAWRGGVVTAIGRIEKAGAGLRRRVQQLQWALTND